jgi:hypothetical protein
MRYRARLYARGREHLALKFAFAELIFLMLLDAWEARKKPDAPFLRQGKPKRGSYTLGVAELLLSGGWFDWLCRFFGLGDFLRIIHGEQQELAKGVTPVIALPG